MRASGSIAAAFLCAACDPGVELVTDVHVAAASQAAVTAYPQQVVFRWTTPEAHGRGTLLRIGVLCAASDAEAVFSATVVTGMCPDLEIAAWLAPLDLPPGTTCEPGPREDELPFCDRLDPVERPDCLPPAGAPRGEAYADTKCSVPFDAHRNTASLTLAPPP